MYFAVFVTHKPDMLETRNALFDDFQAYLRDHPGHPDVVVHHAGPTLADDGETIFGLLNVIEAPSLEAAKAFVADSPYAKAEVFADAQVRAWDWLTGRPG